MSTTSRRQGQSAGEGGDVWIVCADRVLIARIEEVLHSSSMSTRATAPGSILNAEQWPDRALPSLVVLDVNLDIDIGRCILQKIRQARIDAPVVALTKDFSKEFGAKIISEGVRYYFPHDFCAEEFIDVCANLLKEGKDRN